MIPEVFIYGSRDMVMLHQGLGPTVFKCIVSGTVMVAQQGDSSARNRSAVCCVKSDAGGDAGGQREDMV